MAEQHSGLAFVRALYQCRELGAALTRFSSPGSLYDVKRALASAGAASSASHEEAVSSGAALVAKLVLKELDVPEHRFTCEATEEGLEVVQHLQRAVFGEGSMRQGFVQCVYLATLAQAVQALQLVTAALLDLVAPHNCLSLLSLASGCGCGALRRKARALALRAFPAACQRDPNGLLAMEEETLMRLLCSDALRVGSELDVFHALVAWTECEAEARRPRFAAHLAACVRLGGISMDELYTMDDHPLVAADRLANMLMAQVYLHMAMGVPLDSPLGLRTSARRRHCQRSGSDGIAGAAGGAQEPAAAGEAAGERAPAAAACGLAEHAGRHGSAFEAAVCGFSRRRQQAAAAEAGAGAGEGVRRTSADACGTGLAAEGAGTAAPGCGAPSSPAALTQAPTPTVAAQPAAAGAAAPVQTLSRVRHVGVPQRAPSRRTLFAPAPACGEQEPGSKAAPAAAEAAAAGVSAAAGTAGTGDVVLGSVGLEMCMSPSRSSLQALVQQAAAAAAAAAAQPEVGAWESRKRLRFE